MKTYSLEDTLSPLPKQHQTALRWFWAHRDERIPWPKPLADGTLLASIPKGIYKPKWSQYALSVRQSVRSRYPDQQPERRSDGTWQYLYFQEGLDPNARDLEFTNRGLMACGNDQVPVGVLIQFRPKPNARYDCFGLAMVAGWDTGYFILEGFNTSGIARALDDAARDAARAHAERAFKAASLGGVDGSR